MAELPIYRARQVPEHLMTLRQLRELGLRPTDPDRADALLALGLFDRHAAVPAVPPPPAARRISDELAAAEWARAILADPRAVVLDLECTDVHGRVIEIAVVAVSGEVLFETLINPEGVPIAADATAKHGITADMVAAAHVPRFGDIIDELTDLLRGTRIIAWNAPHDKTVLSIELDILAAAGYAVHTPWLEGDWEDAMLRHAAWAGEWDDVAGQYRRHPLEGGHRALGDCHAVLNQLHHMSADSPPRAASDGPSRSNEPWDDEDKNALVSLHREGLDPAEIAERLHRSELAVRFRLYKLDLAPFPADVAPPSTRTPKRRRPYTMDDLAGCTRTRTRSGRRKKIHDSLTGRPKAQPSSNSSPSSAETPTASKPA